MAQIEAKKDISRRETVSSKDLQILGSGPNGIERVIAVAMNMQMAEGLAQCAKKVSPQKVVKE